jgi:primase-polymerase (primpol)-like protein
VASRGYCGVGFVFSSDDPYVGIDLDGCRNPQTGYIEPWALEIVRRLNSYTEISRSGTGLHIIAKGRCLRVAALGFRRRNGRPTQCPL